MKPLLSRILTYSRRAVGYSVFATRHEELVADAGLLITLFHRGSAVGYMLLAIWSASSIPSDIPAVTQVLGDPLQTAYSCILATATVAAAVGATFPARARTELYAGMVFLGLIALYYLFLLVVGITTGDASKDSFAFLAVAFAPITVVRSIFIYRRAVALAEERRARSGS